MSSVLKEICDQKATHIKKQRVRYGIAALEVKIKEQHKPRGFIKTLRKANGPALIAEVKKASPSKGIIREDFDPVDIARTYEKAGADCLSVLTDEPYFQGKDIYLRDVIKTVSLPVLRKDFMIDPYQVIESRALGADCILLIMAALSDSQAAELYQSAQSYGMDVLVEVHDAAELDRAMNLSPAMIGVNNRNLKTLDVDTQTSHDLLPRIPGDILKIAESGLDDSNTIHNLYHSGYNAFLIGESLMREKNITEKIALLFPEKSCKIEQK